MASFWKKISKTFLTLLLLVGVFFAGFAGLSPTHKANAVFTDSTVTSVNASYDKVTEINGKYFYATGGYYYFSESLTPSENEKVLEHSWDDAVLYANNSLYVVKPMLNYVVYKSEDCLTFTAYETNLSSSYSIDEIYFLNNKLIVEASLSSDVYYESSDLYNWTKRSELNDYFADKEIYLNKDTHKSLGIVNNYLYVAVSNQKGSYICKTADFNNWEFYEVKSDIYFNDTTYITSMQIIHGNMYLSIADSLNDITYVCSLTLDYTNMYAQVNKRYTNSIVSKLYNARNTLFLRSANGISYVSNLDDFSIKELNLEVGRRCFVCSNMVVVSGTSSGLTYFINLPNFEETATITFKDFDNSVISTQELEIGSYIENMPAPTREGYEFIGWDKDVTEVVTQDVVFTAMYKIKSYTVIFYDFNGIVLAEFEINHGSTIPSSMIPTPTREGFSFSGWSDDIRKVIKSNTTFTAFYTRNLTLTINYLEPYGTAGFVNQFAAMRPATKVFNYVYGDEVATTELETWYNTNIIQWETDYETDGLYDYTYKLTGWDRDLPTEITNNIIVNATYEKLNTVTLVYYSQLRFLAYEENDGTDYYYTFIGYLTVDKLMADGEVINIEDFKHPNANYHIYNASRNTFYNNLEHFEFLGWDKDITAPITEDITITGQYKLPTVQIRLFDADQYFIGTTEQEVTFMTIEDLQALEGAGQTWDRIHEGFRLFFSLQWGDVGELIADTIDFSDYLQRIKRFHTPDCQLFTAFIRVNTDYPEYGGIFNNGFVATSSPCLSYYTGTANENNMSFWINPIIFATNLYPLTCTVSYANALHSIVKYVAVAVDSVGGFLGEYWWIILIAVLAIIFRKPLIAGLSLLFRAIGKGTKKLSAKIKSKSKNSEYKKTEKEYTAVKKQSKKKEKR